MAINSVNNSSKILGMASGIDTESIVKNLMQVEQLKVKKFYQQKTRLEWNKDAQQEIRSLISKFRNTTMSVLSPETNINNSSAYNTLVATMSQTTSAVQITSTALAIQGQHNIDSITRIASGSNTQSSQVVLTSGSISTSTTLENLTLDTPLQFAGTDSDTISFKLNNEEFIFKKTDTLQTVINTVNASKAGVKFVYSELSNKFSLQSTATGASTKIDIINNLGNFFGASSAIKISDAIIQNGQNALLRIDGIDVSRSSNDFSIDGINYSLISSSTSSIGFRIDQNLTATVDRISAFLKLYNQLVTELQDKLSEEKFNSFKPLTDTEKESMTENEIKLWEEKAKSGQFRNDRSLTSLLNNMRSMFFAKVDGVGKSLSEIGFQTGSYKEQGIIYLDETKLRKALSENPTIVSQLFIKSSASLSTATKYTESGLIPKLINQFNNYNGLFKVSTANQDIIKADDRINILNTQLSNKESYYYKRFAAMEQALSSMQSQSAWLSKQFG